MGSRASDRLFSFEGIDGCGKSTQIRLLAESLQEQGHVVQVYREPGGSRVSEAIRATLLDPELSELCPHTELLLYTASRMQLLHEKVLPDLRAGHVVLLDRFADSTTAYQGHGRRLPLESVRQLNALVREVAWPRRTWWLDLSPEESLRRARGRNDAPDRMEAQQKDFFERVGEGYAQLADEEPGRILRLDASGSVGQIAGKILEDALRHLG